MAATMFDADEMLSQEQIEDKKGDLMIQKSRIDACRDQKERLEEELAETKEKLQKYAEGELLLSDEEVKELVDAKKGLHQDLKGVSFTIHRVEHSLENLSREIETGRGRIKVTAEKDIWDDHIDVGFASSTEEEETLEEQLAREEAEEKAALERESKIDRKWRRRMRQKKREAKADAVLRKAERIQDKQNLAEEKNQAVIHEKQRLMQEAILKLDPLKEDASHFLKEKRNREIQNMKEKIEENVDKQEI